MSFSEPTTQPIEVLVRGQQNDGHLAVIDMAIPRDSDGPPLHVHPMHAEGFYILDGELEVQIGDRVVTASAGSFAFAPTNTPHTFANFSGRDARILVLCTPAGFEPYFDRLAAGQAAQPPSGQAIAVGPQLSRGRDELA